MSPTPGSNKVTFIPELNQTRIYNAAGDLIDQREGDQTSPSSAGAPNLNFAKDTRGHLKPSTGGTNAITQSGKDLGVDTLAAIPYMAGPEGGVGAAAIRALLSGGLSGGADALLNPSKGGGDVAWDAAKRVAAQNIIPFLAKGIGGMLQIPESQWLPHSTTTAAPSVRSSAGSSSSIGTSTGATTRAATSTGRNISQDIGNEVRTTTPAIPSDIVLPTSAPAGSPAATRLASVGHPHTVDNINLPTVPENNQIVPRALNTNDLIGYHQDEVTRLSQINPANKGQATQIASAIDKNKAAIQAIKDAHAESDISGTQTIVDSNGTRTANSTGTSTATSNSSGTSDRNATYNSDSTSTPGKSTTTNFTGINYPLLPLRNIVRGLFKSPAQMDPIKAALIGLGFNGLTDIRNDLTK